MPDSRPISPRESDAGDRLRAKIREMVECAVKGDSIDAVADLICTYALFVPTEAACADRDRYKAALERIALGHTQGTSSRGVDELMLVACEALGGPDAT